MKFLSTFIARLGFAIIVTTSAVSYSAPTSSSPIKAKKGSQHSVGALPQLSPITVFDWGLRRQGSRVFGIYGRLLKTSQRTTNSSPSPMSEGESVLAWAHRGQLTQTITWVEPRPLSLNELYESSPLMDKSKPSERERFSEIVYGQYQEAPAPADLPSLNTMYLAVSEVIRVNPEPLSGSIGYRLEELRIFRASPPYELISLSHELHRGESRESLMWLNQKWTFQKDDGVKRVIIDGPAPSETLHSRLWSSDPYHVGGGYESDLYPSSLNAPKELKRTKADKVEIKVRDRRFERMGGVWSERVEWSVPHFLGAKEAHVIVDQHHMIRAISLDEGLFAIERSSSQLKNRTPLALEKHPLTLQFIQSKRGIITPDVFKRMTSVAKPAIYTCLQSDDLDAQKTLSHIVLRLSLNAKGRLISAGATRQLPWNLTKCLLHSIRSLKFPPPRPAPRLDQMTLEQQEMRRGATLAWPISLSKRARD